MMELESQGRDSWEIALNFNCNLESQMRSLLKDGKINLSFLDVERKSNK